MDEHPEDMLPLANAFQRQTRFRLGAEEYKRPKGTAQPPLDQWYNRKNLDLTCDREIDDLLYSRALVDELLQAYEALCPITAISPGFAAKGNESYFFKMRNQLWW